MSLSASSRQQEAVADGLFGGFLHGFYVALVGSVALFERRARVVCCQVLGFSLREGLIASGQSADFAFVESAGRDVPAQVGAQGRGLQDGRHSA